MENSIEDMLTKTMMYRVKSYHERIMISTKEAQFPKCFFVQLRHVYSTMI